MQSLCTKHMCALHILDESAMKDNEREFRGEFRGDARNDKKLNDQVSE